VKTETPAAALMVNALITLALVVVVVAMADGNGDGCQNRVSGDSSSDSGYGDGRQQQKLWGQATICCILKLVDG
jgi:hypothetical protein